MTNEKDLRIPDYLQHILEFIGRIEAYLVDVDQFAFFESLLLQDAVMRYLEIIGDADGE